MNDLEAKVREALASKAWSMPTYGGAFLPFEDTAVVVARALEATFDQTDSIIDWHARCLVDDDRDALRAVFVRALRDAE